MSSPETQQKIIKQPLSERGSTLPIGILDSSGNVHRGIECREWRLKEEKELGQALEKVEVTRMGQYISTVIGTLCTQLGPFKLDTMKPAERSVIISNLWMPDVFFAYLWLRVQTMGNILNLKLGCPHCGTRFDYSADLNSVNINSVEKFEDALWGYHPIKSLELRGKKVSEMTMGPARWAAIDALGDKVGKNFGIMKAGLILGSIYSVDGVGGQAYADHELDGMYKIDVETLTNQIDRSSLGPDMSVEDVCGKCGKNYRSTLDWGNESFFGISSR
jgi:hypothetical protein